LFFLSSEEVKSQMNAGTDKNIVIPGSGRAPAPLLQLLLLNELILDTAGQVLDSQMVENILPMPAYLPKIFQ
jgi:hypothetical protein